MHKFVTANTKLPGLGLDPNPPVKSLKTELGAIRRVYSTWTWSTLTESLYLTMVYNTKIKKDYFPSRCSQKLNKEENKPIQTLADLTFYWHIEEPCLITVIYKL